MKNVHIGVKLVFIGTLIMVVSIGIIAYLAVDKASKGLSALEYEQLSSRSREITQTIERVFAEERKVVMASVRDDAVSQAATLLDEKGAEKAAKAIEPLNARLEGYIKTRGLGDDYQAVLCIGLDGTVFAASDPAYLGVSFAGHRFFESALLGTTNTGATGENPISNKRYVPAAAPILSPDEKIVGVFVLLLDIGFLDELVGQAKIGKTGYAMVIDETGLLIASGRNKEESFKVNLTTEAGSQALAKSMIEQKSAIEAFTKGAVQYTAGYAPVRVTLWSVALVISTAEYLGAATEVRNLVLLVSAAALVASFLIFFFLSRSITRPLARGVEFAHLIAGGDFTGRLDIHQRDEIGMLADSLNAMSERLRETVSTIQESADVVASSSGELSAASHRLAEGSQNQASSLEQTSAAVEELTASVDQVAQNARSQADAVQKGASSMAEVQGSIDEISKSLSGISVLAASSVAKSQEGFQAVQQVVDAIGLIADSSEKINGIVTVISDIADQTNLLALNASIEAARAGEHGRGFAVVADEVSKLADKSSSSTKEIEALIKQSVKNVARGVEIAKGSQTSMGDIKGASQNVEQTIKDLSRLMGEQMASITQLSYALSAVSEMSLSISAATDEQTTNAKQVAKAVESVNGITQDAAAAAEEMSSSTEQLSVMAQRLQKLTAQFMIAREEQAAGARLAEARPTEAPAALIERGPADEPKDPDPRIN